LTLPLVCAILIADGAETRVEKKAMV